jgi:hypothetical protein
LTVSTGQGQQPQGTAAGAAAEPELSIVIPCLDEAATLEVCIRKAQRAYGELGVGGEVVVADNGSSDGSAELAERLGARVIHVQQRGYGSALAAGIETARGRYVIIGDADATYDFGAIGTFLEGLRAGNDLVVGNRFKGSIEPGAMPFLHRHLGNPALSFVGRRLFGTPCSDIYCGLRGFDRRRIQALGLRSRGMEFAIEMIVKATAARLRIGEVPIVLAGRGDRRSHLKTWRDGWRSLRLLLLCTPRWLFLYPGLTLLAIGSAGMAWLLPAQRTVGSVTFDVSTLLYAALAIVLGLQSVLFFFTARTLGIAEGLLPSDPTPAPRRLPSLEAGLTAGGALALAGLGVSFYALGTWNDAGFGNLDYPHILRLVIPGSTLILCGFQTILASLFVAMLGLRQD